MKISIVVPVYKVEKELNKCINSLINQNYKNIEILLIDDGSPDRCPQICDEYARTNDRIKVIHKANGGLSDARNVGIEAATGDYILFVDSDDYIELDTCQRFANLLSKCRNEIDIVVGEYRIVDGINSHINGHTMLSEEKIYSSEEYMNNSIPFGEFYCPAWLNLYSRVYIESHNLRFCKGLLHEDMEWTPKCFLKGAKIGYLKGYFYNYIIREGSITKANNYDKHINDSLLIYFQWKKEFSDISSNELRKNCNHLLTKCFINTCAKYNIPEDKYSKVLSKMFILQTSREKTKAILFVLNNRLYYWLYDITQKIRGTKI